MKSRSGLGSNALIPFLLILAAALLIMGLCTNLLLLEIGNPELRVRVSEGDVFVLSYTHSMYQVPVSEKFRVEDGNFRLVHVMTQSDAVLEYLGLDKKDEPNVDRTFEKFTIPAASIGNHVLRVRDRDIALGNYGDQDGRTHVKLVRVPLMAHIAWLVWR